MEELNKVATLEAAPFNVRINAVGPGPIETGMLHRFTGDAAHKEAFLTGQILSIHAAYPPSEPTRILMCIRYV